MTRIVVFANRKGGCGKTTTAVNISHALAMRKKAVLLIDMDPQAHASLTIEPTSEPFKLNLSHFLKGEASFNEVTVQTRVEGIRLISSSPDLIAFEKDSGKYDEMVLSERLSEHMGAFDYVILDTPSNAGLLSDTALVAASELYIPMPMHALAMMSLENIVRSIYYINSIWNSNLRLKGIIPTFFNKHTRLSRKLISEIVTNFGKDTLMPPIRMNITLAESPAYGQTIIEYAPKSSGALDYTALAEAIDRV